MRGLTRRDYGKKSKKQLIDELLAMQEKLERLEGELARYKNPNTPPSANPHLKQATPKNATCKRGRPPGCEGSTRPVKGVSETRVIIDKECPNCHDADLELVSTKRRQIEELPTIKPVIVEVYRSVLRCNSCGLKFVSRDDRTPMQGRFGLDLIVIVIFSQVHRPRSIA